MSKYDRERRFQRRVAPFSIKTYLFHHIEDVGEIFNLSEGGAGIYIYTEFLAGQKVSLNFFLPKNLQCEESFPIFAIGEVIWQKEIESSKNGQMLKAGIKFELILPEHVAIIRNFIDSIPEQKPTN